MNNTYKIIAFITILVIIKQPLFAQEFHINNTFNKDTTFNIFNKIKTVCSIKLNADITLNSEKSLIRVILNDSNKNEFLIYETYYEIAESNKFSINLAFAETEFLNDIVPKSVTIQITDASIKIKSLLFKSDVNKFKLRSVNIAIDSSIRAKNNEKIGNINVKLKKNNIKWGAGETDISNLTYMKKKAYFGKDKYNSHGLEYYIGGIFEIKDYDSNLNTKLNKVRSAISYEEQTQYIDHFDWREKHGANNPSSPYYTGDINGWITPVKTQWSGTCWAYSAVGATEALVNLYYNQSLDLDLAEHDAASCSGGGDISHPEWGGSVTTALNYIKNTGVVNESCFPNPINDIQLPCVNKCSNPTEKIKISNYSSGGFSNENILKSLIFKSPMTFAVSNSYIHHATVLVGYRIVKEGDTICNFLVNSYQYIYQIQTGDSLIGKTCWIVKNTGGTSKPHSPAGYTYYVIDDFDDISPYSTCSVSGPITSLQYTDNDIKSVDLDGDGYYNWGVGLKPATCPTCASDEEDGDDSNPNLGPMDTYGFCRQLTSPLTYPDMTISSNTTMNTKNILCGNLFITNGATLTISDKLIMPVNSTITISANSKLIVDGGTITYANIIAQSGSELTLQNNAVLQLYKNDELNINIGAIFNDNYGDIQILNSY